MNGTETALLCVDVPLTNYYILTHSLIAQQRPKAIYTTY